MHTLIHSLTVPNMRAVINIRENARVRRCDVTDLVKGYVKHNLIAPNVITKAHNGGGFKGAHSGREKARCEEAREMGLGCSDIRETARPD
ncbi:hypothetical protein NDU88_008889 [Pleurodeles waltl]|uniref:Uncharacterized protein n=1 Tax=Pleurodeles waltl TaxID=8319 RepID=A0AAV7PQM9_PLEWA|nr:hypothetical protein NDU88_008889 [Pleurodeles waltl]